MIPISFVVKGTYSPIKQYTPLRFLKGFLKRIYKGSIRELRNRYLKP